MKQNHEFRPAIRYSEAFKLQVVRELERGEGNFSDLRRKYGIKGIGTLREWVNKYGNGSIGKVIRVEQPEEVNEKEQLKQRVRALERALVDTNLELALERQYTRLACQRAGIDDVAEFKKKAAGPRPTEP
jgi:transposase-like protein